MDVEQNKESAPPVQNDAIQSCIDSIESYEDLVRHHVEKFYTSAKLHRHETDLSQRVLEWEDSITPFLEAENGHPEFDIHQNGDDVMRKFDRVGQEMMFLDVVQGESPWSVCRRFSATLQLANDSNFHLHTNPDFNSTVNSLQLKLLSKQKSRERLDDYLPL
uniref:Condensin-2 complex subunit H2 n=1 Tax=Ciona savignyi TaxID=51511 RepID=H2ZMC4_CIOSA